jgi:hypothetical protein
VLLNGIADVSDQAFPSLACAEFRIGKMPLRLFRISFSGELAYEIAMPANYGDALVRALMVAAEQFGATPYGTEALSVLRIEKGHAAGAELNGQTVARDLGLGRMMSTKKDFIGRAMAQRPALVDPSRPTIVGLRPVDPTKRLRNGQEPLAPSKQGWPISWSWRTADRTAFLRAISRFSGNNSRYFGRLLTPLVNGVRVAGPFRPSWSGGSRPKLVILDGEGLGHTPRTSTAVSTNVVRLIEEADAVVLVDNATQPMQAAPVAAMRELVSSGNASKAPNTIDPEQTSSDFLPNTHRRETIFWRSLCEEPYRPAEVWDYAVRLR